jgi:hypothetical protein
MGDAGEGLIDNDARIQERRDELQQARRDARRTNFGNPALTQQRESLRLSRAEIKAQLQATTHERRKAALRQALADIEQRLAALGAEPGQSRI